MRAWLRGLWRSFIPLQEYNDSILIFQEQEDSANKENGNEEDKQALIDMFVELVKIDQAISDSSLALLDCSFKLLRNPSFCSISWTKCQSRLKYLFHVFDRSML